MHRVRGIVCFVTLVLALAPLSAFADSSEHSQAELANAEAQLVDAQQTANNLQAQAQVDASNERMIGLLRSEAMRLRQLDMTNNATAIEQIAAALAAADQAMGTVNATNELIIAQTKAASLVAVADANVANGRMLAINKGRDDEFANALAQSAFAHQIANFISGQLAMSNQSNAEQRADAQANGIEGISQAQATNDTAMGANALLAGDLALAASQLAATSDVIHGSTKASNVLSHAEASLANARAMAH